MNLDDYYTEALRKSGRLSKPSIGPQVSQKKEDYRPYFEDEELQGEQKGAEDFALETIKDVAVRMLFSLPSVKNVEELPCSAGIYFLYKGPELLYVGSSRNLRVRWRSHLFRHVLGHPSYRLDWKYNNHVYFVNHENEEAFYIALLQPRLNVIISRVQLKRFPGDHDGGPPDELIEACTRALETRK